MRHTWIGVATLVALSVARPTHAAAASRGWTNGGFLGADANGFYGTVGYPGISVGYLRGVGEGLDAGARFSFSYGGQGVPSLSYVGLQLAADFKLKVDPGLPFGALVLRAQPGVDLFFPPSFTIFNLSLPLELAYGFPVAENLLVHLSVEVPLAFGFWSGLGSSFTSLDIPVLLGGGVELKIDQALSVHGQLHMGPYQRILLGGGATPYFAVDALIGVTYRLP